MGGVTPRRLGELKAGREFRQIFHRTRRREEGEGGRRDPTRELSSGSWELSSNDLVSSRLRSGRSTLPCHGHRKSIFPCHMVEVSLELVVRGIYFHKSTTPSRGEGETPSARSFRFRRQKVHKIRARHDQWSGRPGWSGRPACWSTSTFEDPETLVDQRRWSTSGLRCWS